ncbi:MULTISPECIES: basic amino acid/polyamine antiporter [unclassified Corynebacterium]|uniref:basic amino acid/polyamine antiporter n=1 Tax=unclassified Corynebacterium TaxID=2624378 RepID=UPI0008A53757|nr:MULTISPECIES: basic amino acid/polyamine antiporter [unclassified Corynebacterium]OFP36993.1 lysine transporter [Corynebacterium sp. HMSC071B10]OHF40408.1 lysine transporter [Corynebacterium sp. HMSC074A01]
MTTRAHTVTMWTLVSLIIGSTIGSGIFALPQNIGSVASPGAMLIGWVIAGVGMLSIAFVFQILARRKPHLDSGVYSYVRAGLGDFIGFTSGLGYWLGSVMAQVGYATLFFSTIGYYVPAFKNTWVLAGAVTILTWTIFAMLTRGVKQAAVMNVITTIAKLVPILCFIVLVAFLGFSWDKFTLDFWGDNSAIPFSQQLQGIMLYTVWVFIGIEGASVYSKQARTRNDVGRATIIGFLSVLLLLVAVSTLSYGVLTQPELAALPENSMGAVLEAVVGPWGGVFISIGLCLSVLGAYVSWQMLCAEPIVLMANDGLLPKALGKTTNSGAPFRAQLVSTLVIQLFVIIFFANEASYNAMVQLATIMYLLPYIFSALYLVLLSLRGKGLSHPHAGTRFDDSGPETTRAENQRHMLIGAVGFVYSLWLIYAADPVYVLLGALAVVPGIIPYVWTRISNKERLFNAFEWVVVGIVVLGAVVAVLKLLDGTLTLS